MLVFICNLNGKPIDTMVVIYIIRTMYSSKLAFQVRKGFGSQSHVLFVNCLLDWSCCKTGNKQLSGAVSDSVTAGCWTVTTAARAGRAGYLLSGQGQGPNPHVIIGDQREQTDHIHDSSSHASQRVFHMTVIPHLVYTFQGNLSAVRLTLCRCAVKRTKFQNKV